MTTEFECKNCGECCGPIPVTQKEYNKIIDFLKQQKPREIKRMKRQEREPLTCLFRDIEKKNCFIHPVRPIICRMQGLYEGLPCPVQSEFATKSKQEGHWLIESGSGGAPFSGVLGESIIWPKIIKAIRK